MIIDGKFQTNDSPLPLQTLLSFSNFSEAQLIAAIAEATPRTKSLLNAKTSRTR